MKFMTSALVLTLVIGFAHLLRAQEEYGQATLERGTLTVLRQGDSLKFQTANEQVPVLVGDLLRVGADSRVTLRTREKSTIAMGANAVFQVKPFQQQEKQGFARLLFGRFRSLVEGLFGGETVNTKTATAVIGVKGTENLVSVTPRGNTMTIGVQDVTDLIGQTGEEVPIGPNTVSIVLGDRSATLAVVVPPAVLDQFAGDNLDSPNPTSPEARRFPGQNALVQAGIVSQDDLDEAQSEDVDDTIGDEPVADDTEPPSFEDLGVTESGLDDIKENLFRADVQIDFQP